MSGTETDSVTETREQSQTADEVVQTDTISAIPSSQVTTNEAVNAAPTVPLQDTAKDSVEALGQRVDYEPLGVSGSEWSPSSETAMNTRINAGNPTEGPRGMQHGGQPEVVERDALEPRPAASDSASRLPPGFQAYAPMGPPVIPSPGASSSDRRPPSETAMNTRINAGDPAEGPPGVRRWGQSGAVERDALEYGSAAPQPSSHFTPWLSSPAPLLYASPFSIKPAEGPLPAGPPVIPSAPYIPSSPYIPPTPFIPPQPVSSPPRWGGDAYAPVIPPPPSNPYVNSYIPSPFALPPVHPRRWGYEGNSESPYYAASARAPIARRKEVYVSHDPFHKSNQYKTKPSRIPYNPYVPAGSVDVNGGRLPPWQIPYGAIEPLPPPGDADYPTGSSPSWYRPPSKKSALKRPTYDSQASDTFYPPTAYPSSMPQPPTTSPYPRRRTYDPQWTSDQVHIPGGPVPGGLPGSYPLSMPPPSGGVFIPRNDSEVDIVPTGPSGNLEPSPPPSPRSSRNSIRRPYSPSSPAYSIASRRSRRSTSPVYSSTSPTDIPPPAVIPHPTGDENLPPPHDAPMPLSSASALSLSSVSRPASIAASSKQSAPSPTSPAQAPSNGSRASLSSKNSYIRHDPSLLPPHHIPLSMRRPFFASQDPGDAEKQDSRPYRPVRHGIGRVIPERLRSWGRRVSRWASLPRPSRPALSEGYTNTSSSDEKSGIAAAVIEFTTRRVPTDLYLVFLLFLPSFYFSRVARLFEEAELAMPEIEQMAIRTSLQAQNFLDEQVPEGQDVFPLQWIRLKSTWEHFIDSLLREWKTLNVISALLLSAILTILQIDDAANDYLTRYTALLSFICSLVSLLFGCIYIIRFATMRKTYKAAEWAMEAQESGTSTWWNVFILLALPSIWLTWSILLYVICIMSYIWRTAPNTQESPPPLSDLTVLKIRIGITILLGLALVYACFVLATFRRYGRAMDVKWAARIDNWRLGTMYPQAGTPAPARWDSPYPYASYPGGSMLNSVPRGIDRDRRSIDKSQVHFRDNESYIPRMSAAPSDSPANAPHSWGERSRDPPARVRERGTGSYDIYQSSLSSPPPILEASRVSTTQADNLSPLGLTDIYSERPPPTPFLGPDDLPSQHSPASLPSSLRDKPSVASASSPSLKHYEPQSRRIVEDEPPPRSASSVVEEQRISPAHVHAEPVNPDSITRRPLPTRWV